MLTNSRRFPGVSEGPTMGTPFTAEDQLVRRSLFSSIIGVANRLKTASNSKSSSAASAVCHFDEQQQPCCSSQIFQQQPQHELQPVSINPQPLQYSNSDRSQQQFDCAPISPSSAQCSPATALGQQLDRQLDLNHFFPAEHTQGGHFTAPFPSIEQLGQGQSPHEIYREIVRECRALEQQQHCVDAEKPGEPEEEKHRHDLEENRIIAAALDALPANLVQTPQLSAMARSPETFSPTDSAATPPQNPISPSFPLFGTAAGLSLEHLVATVREVTGSAAGQKQKGANNQQQQISRDVQPKEEPAEVILERRRQQNNAAAARYRRRQRQVESGLQEELEVLQRRNWQLKAEVAQVRAEIEAENAKLQQVRQKKEKL